MANLEGQHHAFRIQVRECSWPQRGRICTYAIPRGLFPSFLFGLRSKAWISPHVHARRNLWDPRPVSLVGLRRRFSDCCLRQRANRTVLPFGIIRKKKMTVRLIIGITAWICGVACALYSAFYSWTALDKVNDRLPVKERFWPLFWSVDSGWKLRHEYRRLNPEGKLLRKARYFVLAFFAFMLIALWALNPFVSRFRL